MNLVSEGLTKRQREVLVHAANGLGEKETARVMGCGVYNVQTLRAAAFSSLQARNITHAVAEAFKRGHLKYLPVLLLCLVTSLTGADERTRVRSGHRARIVTIWRNV